MQGKYRREFSLTFKVAVVERDANAVQFKAFKKGRIFLLEKILKEL